MRITLPHANGYETDAMEFVAAWQVLGELHGPAMWDSTLEPVRVSATEVPVSMPLALAESRTRSRTSLDSACSKGPEMLSFNITPTYCARCRARETPERQGLTPRPC